MVLEDPIFSGRCKSREGEGEDSNLSNVGRGGAAEGELPKGRVCAGRWRERRGRRVRWWRKVRKEGESERSHDSAAVDSLERRV